MILKQVQDGSYLDQNSLLWQNVWAIKFLLPGMHISQNIIIFALLVIDVLLIISILLQQREGGLSTVFGGEGNIYRSKRGIALGLHYFTIALIVLFVAACVAVLFVK
jgi:protein translocase SecG subunit